MFNGLDGRGLSRGDALEPKRVQVDHEAIDIVALLRHERLEFVHPGACPSSRQPRQYRQDERYRHQRENQTHEDIHCSSV
jgi:hypothetical protein